MERREVDPVTAATGMETVVEVTGSIDLIGGAEYGTAV